MHKPSILVARAVFPEVLDKLAQHFTVESGLALRMATARRLTESEDLLRAGRRSNPDRSRALKRGCSIRFHQESTTKLVKIPMADLGDAETLCHQPTPR